MAVARISRINTTPVKSLRLHHPESVELGPDGALEDRRFLLVDDGRRLYNGKRDTSLVRTTASWDPGSRILSMTVPSGEAIEAVPVRSRPEVVEVYGRQVRGHAVDGPWADAISDLIGRSLTLVERDDGAWATDSRPATLISRSSVGLIDGDGRRFRMLFELDGLEALGEEAWNGRRVRVGEATLLVGVADAAVRRSLREPGHRLPRPRRAPRAPGAAGAGRRRVVPRRVRRGARAGDRARG